jgi:S-adenosylmethionine hydrolase
VPRPITFLSDYGLQDEFVGVVHGVIAGIAPEVRVIDVGHGVPRHDALAGALQLERALPYLPAGVHLAVVDPEVGARRRAVAIRTAEEDRLLVGPDNGLLIPAAERYGGAVEAVEISSSPWRLEPVSATFHGRDVFAPVAARLALGEELQAAGEPIEVEDLNPLLRPEPRFDDGAVLAHVIGRDNFGNVLLDLTHDDLARTELRLGRAVRIGQRDGTFARTFADVPAGELLLYEDAGRRLAVAVSSGDASAELDLSAGDEVRLEAG